MSSFNAPRFREFFRFETLSRLTDLKLTLVVPPALVVLSALFSLALGSSGFEWPHGSFLVALLLGVLNAGQAHRREMEATTASFYVLLPVSHLERFMARLTMSVGVVFFGQLILLTALTNLFAGIGAVLGHTYQGVVLPDGLVILNDFGMYLTVHSVFFAGGIFFRTSPFMKTLLAAIFYGIVLTIGGSIVAFARIGEMNSFGVMVTGDSLELADGLTTTGLFLRVSWQVIFPLLLYAAAFQRAREHEVRG